MESKEPFFFFSVAQLVLFEDYVQGRVNEMQGDW